MNYREYLKVQRDDPEYRAAEKEAREAEKEIWLQGDNYISPFVWRRMIKKKG